MSFLYPTFLYGLFALAIPIIVHLFDFRKARKIYFSNNKFLINVKKASSSKLKLKHYLILAARLLFLLFLVITFAQPFIPPPEDNQITGSAVIYLDNSYSMSGEVSENLRGFDTGLKYLQDILQQYPAGTDYKLLTNDFEPFSNAYKSVDEINDRLTEIHMTGIPRKIQDVYSRMISGKEVNFRDNLFLISDFQRSTFGDPNLIDLDSSRRLNLVPIKLNTASNVFIDSLFLENPFLIQNEKNTLNIILKNQGKEDVDDLLMKLLINGVQTSSAMVNIPAGGRNHVAVDLNFRLKPINLCQVSIEDYPVTFDNDFYFVLELSNRISVVEVKETDSITVVQKVYANESLFNFQSFHIRNVDYSALRNADLVVLNELLEFEGAFANVLSEYYKNGGSVFIIPASLMQTDTYRLLLPGCMVIPFNPDHKTKLLDPDLNHPFFADIFESSSEPFDMPEATRILNTGPNMQPILKFRNNDIFLAYREDQGRIYLLTSPLQDSFTDFHRHAIYVPVMYRMGILSKKYFNQLYFSVGQDQIILSLDSVARDELVRLKKDEYEIIPSQRYVGDKLILEIPGFELSAGLYDLQIGNRYVSTLAFNNDKKESILDQISEDELLQIFGEIPYLKIFNTTDIDNFGKELKENYMGKPLWRFALILALIFLLAEVLFIRFL